MPCLAPSVPNQAHLQVLFGSLQLTFVLIPDHIQTEALVDPCREREEGPCLAGEPGAHIGGLRAKGKAGQEREEGDRVPWVLGGEEGAEPPTDLPPECES